MLKILVLAHDISDPAIARRVIMLREGGAEVSIAGFRRSPKPVGTIADCPTVDIGRTYDGNFFQRGAVVLKEVFTLEKYRQLFIQADIVLARNLEMLAIAVRGRQMCHPRPVLIYECLDIHRLVLRADLIGAVFRNLEGWLAQQASELFTSSPAYITNYFETQSKVNLPCRLVENKMLVLSDSTTSIEQPRKPGPPWIIGWFGMIRCRKSLQLLIDLVRQSNGKVEVEIRGRPALNAFDDFYKSVGVLGVFGVFGPYKYPNDLAEMYGNVHFTWAIDMFEEGFNSSWHLPNRLYEGGAFGSIPVALEDVEIGRFLTKLNAGVRLTQPLNLALQEFFSLLTPERYEALNQAMTKVPKTTWICNKADCKEFVDYIGDMVGAVRKR